jgi:hypothetical protein
VKEKLDRCDWYLNGIPKSEIVACYHYEFARQIPELMSRVAELRGTSSHDRFEDFFKLTHQFHCGGCGFFLWYPEWPETPYLAIDKATRQRRVRILTQKPSNEELALKLRPVPAPNYLEVADWASAKINQRRIEIVIRPGLTHAELRKAFAALLNLDFPEQGKGSGKRLRPQGRAGGHAPRRQALEALGIYRLIEKQTVEQASNVLQKTHHPLRCSEQSALSRIRGRAQKAIAKFKADTLPQLSKGSYVDLVVRWMRERDVIMRTLAVVDPALNERALASAQETEKRHVIGEAIAHARATSRNLTLSTNEDS